MCWRPFTREGSQVQSLSRPPPPSQKGDGLTISAILLVMCPAREGNGGRSSLFFAPHSRRGARKTKPPRRFGRSGFQFRSCFCYGVPVDVVGGVTPSLPPLPAVVARIAASAAKPPARRSRLWRPAAERCRTESRRWWSRPACQRGAALPHRTAQPAARSAAWRWRISWPSSQISLKSHAQA
jgi:hypothetical protein